LYHMEAKETKTILDLDKLNDYEIVPLPVAY
jgi:hypothetical protein